MSTVIDRALCIIADLPHEHRNNVTIVYALLDAGLLVTDFQYEYRQRIERAVEKEGI